MNSNLLPLLVLSWVSGHPSVYRYITELPSHWDSDMISDQPYVPVRPSSPSSYDFQIEDPSANYIYSSNFWNKKDPTAYTKRPGSDTSTPTRQPKSAYSHSYTLVPQSTAAEVTYTPVIDGTTAWYPSNDEYYYAGNVYTTPYEFSGTASTFVRPNVLYSTYLTYSKPVYVVNNPYNGYTTAPYVYIYENPKQYVFSTHQQPAHEGGDATKNITHAGVAGAPVKIPNKIQKKPIRTNLTEINIDPITEARKAFDWQARSSTASHIESEIIHKQRPSYYNTYSVIYHKIQPSDEK